MKDSTKLLKYASQTSHDCYGRFEGHDEIQELLKSLTLKSGNRIFRLKDVDYFEFTTHHSPKNNKTNHVSIYFKVQKQASSRELWKNRVLKFNIFIAFDKLSNIKKENWTGYKRILNIRKDCVIIQSKDFRFDSVINLSTKDIYKRGETW